MPTCGDCKKNVDGRCKDLRPNGKPFDMPVTNISGACTPNTDLGEGFVPKEQPVMLGQLLKKKFDEVPAETTCCDCEHFTGEGKICKDGRHYANTLTLKCVNFKLKKANAPKKCCGTCARYSEESCNLTSKPLHVESDWGWGCESHILAEKSDQEVVKQKPSTEKETSTMSNAIIRLADSQFNREVVELGGSNIGLSQDLKEALLELQAKDRKESATAAAAEVMSLLKAAESKIESEVGTIQHARRMEANAKKRIADINRAKAYGLATNNFVPLGVLVGTIYAHHVSNEDLLKIDESKLPEGWDKKPEAKQ